jgi:diguanylate cyclase (GGDEF)-like protein
MDKHTSLQEESISMEHELDKIIRNQQIKTVFQPIISLRDGSVLGHEALSRINCETRISDTEKLFQLASQFNRLWDLELVCRKKSLETAYYYMKPPYDKKLFINVNPLVIHDKKFREGFTKEYLNTYGISPEKIVFEITERNAVKDMQSFQGVIEHYKEQRYEIAIDDAGAGYSGLNLISDICPHYIKLDMKLIRNINKDSIKYALVKSMIELSDITKISIIAEGIETEEELASLVNLGVQYGQGYFIQRPQEEILPINTQVIHLLKDFNRKKNHVYGEQMDRVYIDHICKKGMVISPCKQVEQVFDMFKDQDDLYGLCIVREDKVLGIITREKLMLKLSGRYGFSLNQKKEVTAIMDNDYLEVDYKTPISAVSYVAMERPNNKLYDFIVVTKEGKYHGIVTVKDILQKAMEIDVANAKLQSPLTGMPGNAVIEQEIIRCISEHSEYSILYLDLDNFKAYNDVYGFEKGDLIIKCLAKTIKECIGKDIFSGHIGGDDFVVILPGYHYQSIGYEIIQTFLDKVIHYYNKDDRERGFITALNRHGVTEQYPLISLTIAAVSNQTETFDNLYQLTEELAKIKKKGKQSGGNHIYHRCGELIVSCCNVCL